MNNHKAHILRVVAKTLEPHNANLYNQLKRVWKALDNQSRSLLRPLMAKATESPQAAANFRTRLMNLYIERRSKAVEMRPYYRKQSKARAKCSKPQKTQEKAE